MAAWLSLSADAFAAHPHMLDATLGRALAYFGCGLLLGMRLWLGVLKSPALLRISSYQRTAVLCGLAGALLVVHATLVETADPFALSAGQESTVSLADWQRLLHTAFGAAWLAYGLLLPLGVWVVRQPLAAWSMALGTAMALAATGHAGEQGWLTVQYALGLAHVLAALLWLGGLAILASGRLGRSWHAQAGALQAFSRFALPAFALIVLSGIGRLLLQYWLEGGIAPLYGIFLLLKLAAVAAITVSAWRLRRLLRRELDETRYDHHLGSEVFFTALLVFVTALLTQLPPR